MSQALLKEPIPLQGKEDTAIDIKTSKPLGAVLFDFSAIFNVIE